MQRLTAPEPYAGLQGKGGACRYQGRSDIGATCRAVRRSPQSDYIVEGAAREWGCRCVRSWGWPGGAAGSRREVLHAKIGALTLENDFLEGALNKAGLLSAKR